MRRVFIAVFFALAACAGGPQRPVESVTTLFWRYERVRAIEVLLRINDSRRGSDGSWQIVAQGRCEKTDFDCVLTIPRQWATDSQDPRFKKADVIFSGGMASAVLDSLVQLHFGKVPSVFAKSGYGVFSSASAEHIENEPFEFQGFANDPNEEEVGKLQCLAFVNLPGKCLKLAFLVEGYGGTPPDEVYTWLRKRG